MSYVPLVLGIKPAYPAARCTDIEIIYRSGDKRMRIDHIPIKDAEEDITRHGLQWEAYVWRWMDGLSDWEPVHRRVVRPRPQTHGIKE